MPENVADSDDRITSRPTLMDATALFDGECERRWKVPEDAGMGDWTPAKLSASKLTGHERRRAEDVRMKTAPTC